MNPVQNHRKITRLVQQCFKMLDRLFLSQIQPEFVLELLVHVAVLDVRDVRIHHESDEVENEVRGLPEDGKRGEAERAEARIVCRVGTAHGIDHLFAYLNSWWEGLGVSSKDVAKIN